MTERGYRRAAGPLLVWLAYLALAVVATWPLAARAGSHVFGLGTPPLNIWALGWVQHQLLADPLHLFDGNAFHPYRDSLAFSEHLFVPALLAWPVSLATGNLVLAHNVVALVTLATAGFGMFLLAREITGVPSAAFAAGVLYAFHTWNINELIRLQILSSQWFPFFILAVWKLFHGGGRRWGWLAALFYALQSLSCMYWALYAPLVAGPLLAYLQWRRPLGRREWTSLGAGMAAAGAVIVLFFLPYQRTARALGFERPQPMSVRLDRYLDVLPNNWLYEERLGTARVNQDAAHFLGFAALALAVLGATAPRSRWPGVALFRPLALALALGGTLLSLGPIMQAGEWTLGRGPYWLLREYVPGFGNVRYPERFALFGVLGLAPLVAAGLARLRPRLGAAVVVLAGLVLFAEHLSVPLKLERLPGGAAIPSAYRWLADKTDVRVVADVPGSPYLLDRFDAMPMYLSTAHWKRTVQGFTGYYPPATSYLRWRVFHFPDPDTLDFLARFGVDTVVAGPGVPLPSEDAGWTVAARLPEGHVILRAPGGVRRGFDPPPPAPSLVELPRDAWGLSSSEGRTRFAVDGDYGTAWSPGVAMKGDFFRVRFPEPVEVVRVSIAAVAPYQFPTRLAVIGEREDGAPAEMPYDARRAYDGLIHLLLERPKEARLDLDFEPRRVTALRLRIRESDPFGMPWNMAELRVFTRPTAAVTTSSR